MKAIAKALLLRELGYGGSLEQVEPLLEAAGLSRAGKPNIAPAKAAAVEALLAAHFVLVCGRGDCRDTAESERGTRALAPAASEDDCAVCGGSATQRAIEAMIAACSQRGWRRLCVVGGSPNARERLESGVAGRVELRLISGTERRTRSSAQADLTWADRVVVWGSTQLDHTVSNHYAGRNVSSIARRSIQAVCDEVVRCAMGARKGVTVV